MDFEDYLESFPDLREAYDFMIEAHEGQTRLGGAPYSDHPKEVARIFMEHVPEYEQVDVVAALLHDVVEDTEYTVEDLRKFFGHPVAVLVESLTKPDRPKGMSREDYKALVWEKWTTFSYKAKLIKCADRIHNLRSMKVSGWKPKRKRRYAEEALHMLSVFWDCGFKPEIALELEDEAMEILEELT